MPDWNEVLRKFPPGWRVEAVHNRVVSPDGKISLTLEEAQRPRRHVEHMLQKRGVRWPEA